MNTLFYFCKVHFDIFSLVNFCSILIYIIDYQICIILRWQVHFKKIKSFLILNLFSLYFRLFYALGWTALVLSFE